MTQEMNTQAAGVTSMVHEPPTLTRMGTLSELTLGSNILLSDDGFGAGGDNGDGPSPIL